MIIEEFSLSLGKRLLNLFDKLHKADIVKNKKDFCEKTGIKYAHFNKYIKDIYEFKIDGNIYSKIAELNINLGWLLTGKGEIFLADSLNISDFNKIEKENKVLKEKVQHLEAEIQHLNQELLNKYREIEGLKKI